MRDQKKGGYSNFSFTNLRKDVRKLWRNRLDFFDVEFRTKLFLDEMDEMDAFERAAIDRLFLRGSVIGILVVCSLLRL